MSVRIRIGDTIRAGELLKLCKLCGSCISTTVSNGLCTSCNDRMLDAKTLTMPFTPHCRSCRDTALVFLSAKQPDESSLYVCPKCGESIKTDVLQPGAYGEPDDYLQYGIPTCGKCDKHICLDDGCDCMPSIRHLP